MVVGLVLEVLDDVLVEVEDVMLEIECRWEAG